MTPEHPSQLVTLGTFGRVLALTPKAAAARWRSLANGPLRMAVIANNDAAQANAAFATADRWVAPRAAPQMCTPAGDAALKPGRYDVELSSKEELGRAFIAVNVAARAQVGRALAEVAAKVLAGERGAVQAALDKAPVVAAASVHMLGGAHSAAILVDVRAPDAALEDAIGEVKALFARLGQEGPTEQAVTQALREKQRADEDAAFDPRARLVKLWLGEAALNEPPVTRAALQQFFASSFRESALVIVAGKHR
ncbi:MAG: hypothetical protein IPK82_29980 [Polyangiaceae bacterium]|nr:hypothetical protein [Polyangiaceae bacterium]